MASFVPSSSEQASRDFVPSAVAVVGHSLAHNDQVQHWCLYFQGDGCCVRTDMSVGGDGYTGIMLVSKHDYLVSDRATKTELVTMTGSGTKVGAFLDVILRAGYERYRFTNEGLGCRHWVKTVLRGFADEGLIEDGNLDSIEVSMGKVWPSGNDALSTKPGSFF